MSRIILGEMPTPELLARSFATHGQPLAYLDISDPKHAILRPDRRELTPGQAAEVERIASILAQPGGMPPLEDLNAYFSHEGGISFNRQTGVLEGDLPSRRL